MAQAGGGDELADFLRAMVGDLPVDLVYDPESWERRQASTGRLLASLGPRAASELLKEMDDAGIYNMYARYYLRLVRSAAEDTTPELMEAVMTVLQAADTLITDKDQWEQALEGLAGRVRDLLYAHLQKHKHRLTGEEDDILYLFPIDVALGVASLAAQPVLLDDDRVAVKVFDTTLRLSNQFTVLNLAANLLRGFYPYAEELLSRATEAVSGVLAAGAGSAVVVERGALRRRLVVETTASRMLGVDLPVDFPVRLEFSLPELVRVTSMNFVKAGSAKAYLMLHEAKYRAGGVERAAPFFDYRRLEYDLSTYEYAKDLLRARTLSDVVSWYVQGATNIINDVRYEVGSLSSYAVYYVASREKQYVEPRSSRVLIKDLSRGVYIEHWGWPVAGGPAVGVRWKVVVLFNDEFGPWAAKELLSLARSATYSSLERAIADGVSGGKKLEMDERALHLEMSPTKIVASNYTELYRKVSDWLDRIELGARQVVGNLKALLRTSRPSEEKSGEVVPA